MSSLRDAGMFRILGIAPFLLREKVLALASWQVTPSLFVGRLYQYLFV